MKTRKLPVYNVETPVIPLLASKSSNIFRLFSSDIGLLTSAYPAETKMEKLFRLKLSLVRHINHTKLWIIL